MVWVLYHAWSSMSRLCSLSLFTAGLGPAVSALFLGRSAARARQARWRWGLRCLALGVKCPEKLLLDLLVFVLAAIIDYGGRVQALQESVFLHPQLPFPLLLFLAPFRHHPLVSGPVFHRSEEHTSELQSP